MTALEWGLSSLRSLSIFALEAETFCWTVESVVWADLSNSPSVCWAQAGSTAISRIARARGMGVACRSLTGIAGISRGTAGRYRCRNPHEPEPRTCPDVGDRGEGDAAGAF